MATRQITALFTNNALKNCLTNSPRYTTIAQGKGFVEKKVEKKPEGVAKEKAQEKNTGAMKHTRATEFPPGDTKTGRSPNPSTTIKKTLDEKLEHDLKTPVNREMDEQKPQKNADESYWNEQKETPKHGKDPKASR